MRIIFHSVSWKNLNATGAHPITVSLDTHPTTLIVGKNGAGKTTVIDALCYALFKRPFVKDRTLSELLNTSTGKALWTRVDLSVGSTHWRIERGMKPAVLDIWKNGEPLNSSSIKDTQAFIEGEILRMDFDTFIQMVVLGKSFVPFMRMKAPQRREFVEQLASTQVFGEMSDVLKEDLKGLKNTFSEVRTKLVVESNKLESKKERLEDLKNYRAVHDAKLANLTTHRDAAQAKVDEFTNLLAGIEFDEEAAKELKEEYEECRAAYSRMTAKRDLIFRQKEDAKKAKNCPTCGQPIKNDAGHGEHLAALEKQYQKLSDQCELVLNERENLKLKIGRNEDIQAQIAAHQQDLRMFTVEVRRYNDQIKEHTSYEVPDVAVEEFEIGKQQNLVDRLDDEITGLHDEIKLYETAVETLKDDGVKAYIMALELPRMNAVINESLKKLGLNMKFTLGPTFEETIKARGTDTLSYSSFSEGQKQRIDLAVLFAWRSLAMQKNSLSTNLLFMDEVLNSSMDEEGCLAFLKSFVVTSGEANNIFIIAHGSDGIAEHFSRMMYFEMKGNFSKMRETDVHSGA